MITMHPGEMLTALLDDSEYTQADLARAMQVSPAALSRLLNQKANMTAEMAVRLSAVFEASAEYWMSMQMHYDLARARIALKDVVFTKLDLSAE